MNIAEWIIVVILSVTLLIFLIVGIVLLVKLIGLSEEVKKIAVGGQDIVENANDVVSNVKGMTAIGGTVQMIVDQYINPKIKAKFNKNKEKKDGGKK